MSFWTFLFLCIVAGIGYDVWRKKNAALPRQPVDDGQYPSRREQELQRELAELRDRVKVLERIATEDHQPRRLAEEIERLRDDTPRS